MTTSLKATKLKKSHHNRFVISSLKLCANHPNDQQRQEDADDSTMILKKNNQTTHIADTIIT